MSGWSEVALTIYVGATICVVIGWLTYWVTVRWMEWGDNPLLILCDLIGSTVSVGLFWPLLIWRVFWR